MASLGAAAPVSADVVVATRPISAMEVISPSVVALQEGTIPGAVSDLAAALGREARVALFPGQPILARHLAAPAIIERNASVAVIFDSAGLRIETEGRALGRGGAGDRIRVMNIASRSTLFGTIQADGSILVSP
ncbi:flagellar basal body P-ring formation chaperone FlgA [Roseivivax lentus]|uniref:flagellar basal body P-ring formation chaperone FlgA n=1 Tax=Roseivivax lentus TaxID=633194 RepID=UPI001F2C0D19|nr:flagellar basal body P-ring formation chaperone FlgA [Roseivivax lentus]